MSVVVFPNKRQATAMDIVPPEAFVRQVADALAHLHDLPRLQTHPLARRLAAPGRADAGLGRALQRTLLEALERLRPARHDRMLQTVRAALGEQAFEHACASGRAMTREDAIASALDRD